MVANFLLFLFFFLVPPQIEIFNYCARKPSLLLQTVAGFVLNEKGKMSIS